MRQQVHSYLQTLPQPIVLVQTRADSNLLGKCLPAEEAHAIYRHLLDTLEGTLLVLDEENRTPRLANWRLRHLNDEWESVDTATLLCLLQQAQLLVSIDSGLLQAARFSSIPTLGLFPHLSHYPDQACLPHNRQVNMVVAGTNLLNRKTRAQFNILECSRPQLDPAYIAEVCSRMLAGPRYLEEDQLGQDVLIQQFVREWERGKSNMLSSYVDRDRSYDLFLREISRRFATATIVETGCIRSAEDWEGAGYSTYLLGLYAQNRGGQLFSVDISPQNCEFARQIMQPFPNTQITCQDSVAFLSAFGRSIDALLIDSVDTEHPHAPQHALAEVQAAMSHLHGESLILFDDTPYSGGQFRGKGALAVPWLRENGWSILFSGYQTLLHRLH